VGLMLFSDLPVLTFAGHNKFLRSLTYRCNFGMTACLLFVQICAGLVARTISASTRRKIAAVQRASGRGARGKRLPDANQSAVVFLNTIPALLRHAPSSPRNVTAQDDQVRLSWGFLTTSSRRLRIGPP
jgi:hypothetical protein